MTRTAVVTGGGTGIGRAVAEALADDGVDVVITGRRENVLAKTAADLGERVRGVAFDASDPEAVRNALSTLPERVDVLVNNAGGAAVLERSAPEPGDLVALRELWQAELERNLFTATLVTAALEPRLADHARVVSVGSIAARQGTGQYGAAKAALETWNVGFAKEVGTRGITANVVAPGYIADTEFFHDLINDEFVQVRVNNATNKRVGTPADVTAAIMFLTSADAGHVTGQVLHVDGGTYFGH